MNVVWIFIFKIRVKDVDDLMGIFFFWGGGVGVTIDVKILIFGKGDNMEKNSRNKPLMQLHKQTSPPKHMSITYAIYKTNQH